MRYIALAILIFAVTAVTAHAGVISLIETNLSGDTIGIISTGFGEDALTFSDRTHQHNGAAFDGAGLLSTSGTNVVPLPEYLVGSEYVRFANNARENAGYSATAIASEPVEWYLLVDNRLNGPAGDTSSPNSSARPTMTSSSARRGASSARGARWRSPPR